jgi:hypothetical protein
LQLLLSQQQHAAMVAALGAAGGTQVVTICANVTGLHVLLVGCTCLYQGFTGSWWKETLHTEHWRVPADQPQSRVVEVNGEVAAA